MKLRKILGVIIFAISLVLLQKMIFAKKSNKIQKHSMINVQILK